MNKITIELREKVLIEEIAFISKNELFNNLATFTCYSRILNALLFHTLELLAIMFRTSELLATLSPTLFHCPSSPFSFVYTPKHQHLQWVVVMGRDGVLSYSGSETSLKTSFCLLIPYALRYFGFLF